MLSVPAVTQAAPPSSDLASPSFITGPVGGSPLPTPAPKPTTGPRPSYCVAAVVRATNFRTGPGTGYRAIRLLPKYSALRVYARRGAWLSVTDSRGQRGWVWQPNVRVSSACVRSLPVR
ncbi:MAG TPA: SH3 domain-containing protein [Thermoflexales bacterium]|nr:SH3 domain-containing protein [Thermoflexales bacterium]HQW34251.1 SH3 domain-containing protein [Thermoflexales bacterium]HRA00552.1 SH3 domain-containing protein [Thermoflexales bacterium]